MSDDELQQATASTGTIELGQVEARADEDAACAVERALSRCDEAGKRYEEAYARLWLAAEDSWRSQVALAAARVRNDAWTAYRAAPLGPREQTP